MLGATTLRWEATGTGPVEVRVGAPDGPLLSRSGPVDSANTGEWVNDGMTFYLRDVSAGQADAQGRFLDKVIVNLDPIAAPGKDLDLSEKMKFREKHRLHALPRYERATTTLLDTPMEILDALSFLTMYREIVEEEIYYFPTRSGRPYIIDGGANIGVSVLYFKQIYSGARIVAVEPDDQAFALLKANVERAGHQDVTLVHGALTASEAQKSFLSEGSYAGRIAREGETGTTSVPTARLRSYLDRKVDLLKLNIEGAETEVLMDCADLLHHVERVVLEYHSFANEPQTLHTLLNLLAEAGYRLYVRSVASDWPLQPFMEIPVHLGMDLQLYVYAFRDRTGEAPSRGRQL